MITSWCTSHHPHHPSYNPCSVYYSQKTTYIASVILWLLITTFEYADYVSEEFPLLNGVIFPPHLLRALDLTWTEIYNSDFYKYTFTSLYFWGDIYFVCWLYLNVLPIYYIKFLPFRSITFSVFDSYFSFSGRYP